MSAVARGAKAKARDAGARGGASAKGGRSGAKVGRSDAKDAKGGRKAVATREQPLEQRILLTATLCLMAFGAVMVYSASSASTLLQGHGNGSSYLVKYVIFGALGLALMRF